MATNEPLQVEVSKTLQHILKNVAKKEVEMKNILNKALGIFLYFYFYSSITPPETYLFILYEM